MSRAAPCQGSVDRRSGCSRTQSAGEGSGTHDVEVRLDKAPLADIMLAYTVSGTATSGSDYTALSGTVAVPRGATTATIPVTILDDGVQDRGETVVLTLAAGKGYRVGSPGSLQPRPTHACRRYLIVGQRGVT